MVLTLLTVKTLAPEIRTEATSEENLTVGPYTLSMATTDTVPITITPTDTQTIYKSVVTNNVTVKNTCTAGAKVTMTANGSNTSLKRTNGGDSLTKEIPTTSTKKGTDIDDNSWAFSTDGTNFFGIPAADTNPGGTIYSSPEGTGTTNGTNITVTFAVKTDNNMPSGTYSNDVVYTMVPNDGCVSYQVTWEMDGGQKKSGATYPSRLSWGEKIDLSQLTPTREGYTFAGWQIGSSSSTVKTGSVDLNESKANSVTVKAKWTLVNYVENFDYVTPDGGEQTWTAPYTGYYKLEVWGAQGALYANVSIDQSLPGNGGYSYGTVRMDKHTTIYVIVGGMGAYNKGCSNGVAVCGGGYNGGGNVVASTASGAGGGMTHISLKNNVATTTWNPDGTLIVAGGGGGTDNQFSADYTQKGGNDDGGGGYGGGVSGGFCLINGIETPGTAGTQTSGYSMGVGGASNVQEGTGSTDRGSGGGGWYGGISCYHGQGGGGGGSGWIYTADTYSYWKQNSVDASNVTWTVPTSYYLISAATVAGNQTFKSPTGSDETGHTGNGYARISWLGDTL